MQQRSDQMQQIETEIRDLTHSPLYEYRISNGYQPVIGQGSLTASVMLIGEAPGKNEALSGKPFCGASGKLLDELLGSIRLSREQIYITNIVKDRPPENRDPRPDEIALYAPFLQRQISIIQPRIIGTLGRFSMAYVLQLFGAPEQGRSIGELHGKSVEVQTDYGQASVVPLYHPAVALYQRSQKQVLMTDIQALGAMIDAL
jgi:uracil-DNA glycosylase